MSGKPVFALLTLLFSHAASAELIYEFGQSEYTATPNGTVDVDLYLRQTGGETVLSDFGLISVSGQILFNEAPGPTEPAEVLSTADITINPQFDDPFLSMPVLDPGTSAGMLGVIDITSPEVFANQDRIHLGTFRFTVGSIQDEVTSLRATDLDVAFEDTLTGNGLFLDSLISDGLATITVVPEPSQVAALGGLVLAAIGWRRRRQRHSNFQVSGQNDGDASVGGRD
ncbi:MAG: PEP-CTERM sorting domain-containing protein [Planctomycetaceae bacterium]|nr:PEP-CTERM sorting domain-containing protein [Planctomycetaceae bacterium]